MLADTPALPAHIDETEHVIARPHAGHCRQSIPLQRAVGRMKDDPFMDVGELRSL